MEQNRTSQKRYILAPGSQVREEDFGLLFYTMDGPCLYFLSSKELLGPLFFKGEHTIDQWIKEYGGGRSIPGRIITDLTKSLAQLKKKGVILEC